MKKLLALLLVLFALTAQAANCDLIMTQLDAFGGSVPRLVQTGGCSTNNGLIVYDASGSQQPRMFTFDSTLKFTSGVVGVNTAALPSPTFDFSFPSSRSLSVSTDYQAGIPTKAAFISISPSCGAALSLTGGATCSMEARVGPSSLTCSTGTVVMTWTNGNTGALTIGLNTLQTIGAPADIKLPIGGHFMLCALSGTFTVVTAVDQSAG